MSQHPITSKLLRWYAGHSRDLPWRHTRDPYFIWVSEIMLQQTQVETVIPYYLRFLTKFPSVRALAEARTDEVLKIWENLGYYSRARNLHAAAREISARWRGKLPQDRKALMALQGIGEYTADAILSIAFSQPVAAIDGNVSRVISRLFALRRPLGSPESREQVRKRANHLLSKRHPGHFNQAIMDLGATVCTPQNSRMLFLPSEGPLQGREIEIAGKASCFQKKARPFPQAHDGSHPPGSKKKSACPPEARLRASRRLVEISRRGKRRDRGCRRGFG